VDHANHRPNVVLHAIQVCGGNPGLLVSAVNLYMTIGDWTQGTPVLPYCVLFAPAVAALFVGGS
jgi:hypothetical protein